MTFPPLSQAFLAGAVLFAGLVIGSFLNVVIHRGPSLFGLVEGEPRGDLVAPPSYCPACRTPIPAAGLIPLLSFIRQGGRCTACAAPIPLRYPVVEALGGLVALASLAACGWTPAALAVSIFGFALIALAFIDLETGYLPDAITLPLVALGLLVNALGLLATIKDAVIGAFLGYAVFRGVGFLFERLRGKEGLGQGDAKLLAAIGAWSGFLALPFVVLIGSAATLAIALGSRGRKSDAPIPFGPGLCAAAFLVVLFGRDFLSVP